MAALGGHDDRRVGGSHWSFHPLPHRQDEVPETAEVTDLIEQLLDEEESRKRIVYQDSKGYWTISRGCLVDPRVSGAGLCEAAMAAQDAHDVAKARALAQDFPGFNRRNEVQQAVLISMCFQMGSAPLHWPHFTGALAMDDVKAAAAAGRDSDWWRTETHKRAEREMTMLETGEWIPHT